MDEFRIDQEGRPEPPLTGDEIASLRGYLDYQRATMKWKTDGVDSAGLGLMLAPSTLTLGGLLKHLALVEDTWFNHRLHGRQPSEPWASVDWDADNDWDWHSAAGDTPEYLRSLWNESVERARASVDEALQHGGLEQPLTVPRTNGDRPSLRWVLLHMIEEYARHNGHADLLREAVDGSTGE